MIHASVCLASFGKFADIFCNIFLDVRYTEEKIMRKGDKETEKSLYSFYIGHY